MGTATVDVAHLDTVQRLGRAGASALWWAAGVAAAFVPVAHLILVPACVVGRTFYLVRGLKARAIVTAAHGVMPRLRYRAAPGTPGTMAACQGGRLPPVPSAASYRRGR